MLQDYLCYYEVIFVPFAHSLNNVEYTRFAFSVPKGSTFVPIY